MKTASEGKLLRVFIGEGDRWQGRPLYEAIVQAAREEGMAGATVLKGALGFGAKSHLRTGGFLGMSKDLPIIIEIVDTEEKAQKFLPRLDELVRDGLVTLEKVQVLTYRGA